MTADEAFIPDSPFAPYSPLRRIMQCDCGHAYGFHGTGYPAYAKVPRGTVVRCLVAACGCKADPMGIGQ